MPWKQGDIWYTDFRLRDPRTGRRKRFRLSLGKTVKTRRQAERAEARVRAELELSFAAPPEKQALPAAAFSGFAKHWLELREPDWKPSTYRRNESSCRVHLVPFFGDIQLVEIQRVEVQRFKSHNAKRLHPHTGRPLAPKTVNENLGCLSSMLADAVAWGYLRANPCKGVKPLPLPPRKLLFYDARQTRVWLDTCQRLEPRWFPLFFIGFRTGLRLGELFELRWGDLDLEGGCVHVARSVHRGAITTPKGGRGRTVNLTPETVGVLRAHRHLKGELVFSTPTGEHLTRNMSKHPWGRITAASGLRTIRQHDMRHSFASQLVMAGAPLNYVQQQLGHADIQTTMRYAHLSPEASRSYANLLDGHNLAIPGSRPTRKQAANRTMEVEAAGVEPTSEITQPKRLRV